MTAQLWTAAASIYSAILEHPFVTGLADGSLDRASFQFYIVQDGHYLHGFARALAILAARAPTESETGLFARHTAAVITVERSLHAGLLAELTTAQGDAFATGVAPTTLAYTSYLLATCATRSFSDGVAAVLPCYWIYREVGRKLLALSSPDPLYARWIETYGGDEFDRAVEEMLELTDSIGAQVSTRDRESAIDHFAITARYEWMFWDAAYRRVGWPL
ncbi:MAG: thiaminase II [Candidatus Dormibacteraeota bacterium]|nr:thiaminase II [Candidatus Dormibacteraeota bacterium]